MVDQRGRPVVLMAWKNSLRRRRGAVVAVAELACPALVSAAGPSR
ncbi:MAG: hypothetical protein ACRDYA_09365 [Egibacteraceae bacterium]